MTPSVLALRASSMARQASASVGLVILSPSLLQSVTISDVPNNDPLHRPSPFTRYGPALQEAAKEFDQLAVMTPGLLMGYGDAHYCQTRARQKSDRIRDAWRAADPFLAQLQWSEEWTETPAYQRQRGLLSRLWRNGSSADATEAAAHFAFELRQHGGPRPYIMAALSTAAALPELLGVEDGASVTVLVPEPWPLMAKFLGGVFGSHVPATYSCLTHRGSLKLSEILL